MLFKKEKEEKEKKAPDFNIYYDFSKLSSCDKVFNFILEKRGAGRSKNYPH